MSTGNWIKCATGAALLLVPMTVSAKGQQFTKAELTSANSAARAAGLADRGALVSHAALTPRAPWVEKMLPGGPNQWAGLQMVFEPTTNGVSKRFLWDTAHDRIELPKPLVNLGAVVGPSIGIQYQSNLGVRYVATCRFEPSEPSHTPFKVGNIKWRLGRIPPAPEVSASFDGDTVAILSPYDESGYVDLRILVEDSDVWLKQCDLFGFASQPGYKH